MTEINLLNKEDRKTLILDFIPKLMTRYPSLMGFKAKLLDLSIIEARLEHSAYFVDASTSTNTITIDKERIEEASDEIILFLHQLMRILSGNINELNDGIIEEILSELYPERTFSCYVDEKTVASLMRNIFGEDELIKSLFDNNKNLALIANQKFNQKGFLEALKAKMEANNEEVRFANKEKPISSLADIIVFIFESYINGYDVSMEDLEAFKYLVKEWRTEIIEDYDEEDRYPGVDGIIKIMDDKIAERKKEQL